MNKANKEEVIPQELSAEELLKITDLPQGEIPDEELDAVSGGEIESRITEYMCPYCFSSDMGLSPFTLLYNCISCGKTCREDELAIKYRRTVYRCPQCKSHDLGTSLGMPSLFICNRCGTQFSDKEW